MDIHSVKAEVLLHLAKLEEWTADEVPEDAGFVFGTVCQARIRGEPLGVALIIGTWNFPIVVCLQPLIAAISAGCCALLRPSEVTKHVQDVMLELLPKYMDPEAIRVVSAGADEMSYLLEKKFDHIFFTGSTSIGRVVQAAAAKHLTPTGKLSLPVFSFAR